MRGVSHPGIPRISFDEITNISDDFCFIPVKIPSITRALVNQVMWKTKPRSIRTFTSSLFNEIMENSVLAIPNATGSLIILNSRGEAILS